ncbi:MAG: glycosyltransferase family 4 protein [Cetobacterium sp.]
MKILILANSIIGIYKFRRELLYKFIELGYEVTISSPNDDLGNFIQDLKNHGIKYLETKIDRRGINLLKDLKLFNDYLTIIKKEKPNCILTYTIKPNIYGSLAAQFLKIKYINNVTGLGTGLQNNTLLAKILKKLYKLSFFNSNCIFFQNKANLNFFINNNILNKLSSKIILVPGSGVNLENFYPIEKNEINEEKKILCIGRIMDEKGIREYLNCAINIKKMRKDVEFQLLGALEEEKYKPLIDELEKQGIIKYLGISNDIRKQLKEVDCVVNPSWHEGMSNVLLEAGAMKKFLIASNIPGCNEIVKNNITGLTFKVKDEEELEKKITEYLYMDCGKRTDIVENLYNHINKNFDRNKIIEEYVKIIKNI